MRQYGRAGRALVGTSDIIYGSMCSSLGEGGSHLWDLCTQRAWMLHPTPLTPLATGWTSPEKHWTSPENAAEAYQGVTREDATSLGQCETIGVEWGNGQVATAVHGDARALGIKKQAIVLLRLAVCNSTPTAPWLRTCASGCTGWVIALLPSPSSAASAPGPSFQLGGLPPELVNLLHAFRR